MSVLVLVPCDWVVGFSLGLLFSSEPSFPSPLEASSFNPFGNISESDVEDASQPFQLVDADHDSDEDVEI